MVFNEIIDNSIVIIPSNFKSFLRNYKFINYKLNFKVFSKEDLKKLKENKHINIDILN